MQSTIQRNATLTDLRDQLVDEQARKVDVIAPASRLKLVEGQLKISGVDPVMDEHGVTEVNGLYRPTDVFDEGLADKLKIPISYLRRMRLERPDLMDANVNGWLRGKHKLIDQKLTPIFPADERKFLLRTFRPDAGGTGIARAFLSDRFAIIDNLDVLTATLSGIEQAGVHVDINGCDLSDRRMYVRISAPSVQALAPDLLKGYRSPFSGASGSDNPTVFAGFVVSNSETGDGSFSITPRLIVQVCDNGLQITKDAISRVHLGKKNDEGVIRWTKDTLDKELAVVKARARDAVATFLDVDYMRAQIRQLTETAERPIKEVESIKVIGKRLSFDEDTISNVFAKFVQGGQMTAGGVMQAVTAAARDTADADKAMKIEAEGIRAMELAAAL